MIKKEHNKSIWQRKLEVLIKRMPKNHPSFQKVKEDLAKISAGYQGERSVSYYLSFLPDKTHYIFHDLRLQDEEGRYFQMDILILSSKYMILLEVKNITGTLYFDQEFHQLIRTQQDEITGFPDPVLQTNRQVNQLRSWLLKEKFPEIPIFPYVVISSPLTVIQSEPNQRLKIKNVIHAATLPTIFTNIEKRYTNNILDRKLVNSITRKLLKSNKPYNPDLLTQYKIQKGDIRTGIYCEKCEDFSYQKIYGGWKCYQCGSSSRDVHQDAIKEYVLLFGNKITNMELRHFLNLSSESVARKILIAQNGKRVGGNKNRVYILPEINQ